jgi:microcystin-dependent protein
MADPFLGEIKIVSWSFPPRNWAFCNGQLLPISQNQALFSILGTTYGGDGITTFALPNLQARIPVHAGDGIQFGAPGGEATHTLTIEEIPSHPHGANGVAQAPDQPGAGGFLWANQASAYATGTPDTLMDPSTSMQAGGGQAHNNLPPYLVLNFVIALTGIYPSRN